MHRLLVPTCNPLLLIIDYEVYVAELLAYLWQFCSAARYVCFIYTLKPFYSLAPPRSEWRLGTYPIWHLLGFLLRCPTALIARLSNETLLVLR
jgi:hypothetical protein